MRDFNFYFLLSVLMWAPHASMFEARLLTLVLIAAALVSLWREK